MKSNDMSKKVSIIMPVYNAIKYIDMAIMSVLNQTFTDFELLLIDDGSNDGSGEKCKKYVEKYDNVIYYHQNNKGVCAARNKGIQLAEGTYIGFADHDDKYAPQYLEILMKLAEFSDADLIKCGVYFEDESVDGKIITRTEYYKDRVITQRQLIAEYCNLPVSYFDIWNALYKKQVLIDNGIQFLEQMKHGQEDFYFNTLLIPHLKKIGFTSQCLYYHYKRMNQSVSAKFHQDRIDAMIQYHNLEVEILKPLVEQQKWGYMYSLIYARKITGLIAYCLNTNGMDDKKKCVNLVEDFVKRCPFDEKKTMYNYMKLFVRKLKYFIVIIFIENKKYDILIKICNFKFR